MERSNSKRARSEGRRSIATTVYATTIYHYCSISYNLPLVASLLALPPSCIPFGCPDARMAASFAMDSSSGAAFLYGGFDENGFRSDMHYYNTSRFEWKTVKQQVRGGEEEGREAGAKNN